MKKEFFILALTIVFSSNLVYGSNYSLETDDVSFEITYELNGDVIAMAVDENTTSFLIGITNVEDSSFVISLQNKLISAENNEFVVLVDGVEVNYVVSTQNNVSTLQFFVPADSEEIEIIGTQIIPEFPLGVLAIFAIMIVIVTFVTKTGKLR
ncbi:MAG TPA: hypothetical protein VD689_04490, partial [Nitrosopumilaceae archaeon]|nr:hypothetical protein [Nitrosopumilaceae archaeon]